MHNSIATSIHRDKAFYNLICLCTRSCLDFADCVYKQHLVTKLRKERKSMPLSIVMWEKLLDNQGLPVES